MESNITDDNVSINLTSIFFRNLRCDFDISIPKLLLWLLKLTRKPYSTLAHHCLEPFTRCDSLCHCTASCLPSHCRHPSAIAFFHNGASHVSLLCHIVFWFIFLLFLTFSVFFPFSTFWLVQTLTPIVFYCSLVVLICSTCLGVTLLVGPYIILEKKNYVVLLFYIIIQL